MAVSRGRTFKLFEIWAFWFDSSRGKTQGAHADQRSPPHRIVAKNNILGLGLVILMMYWSPSTRFKVLELAFTVTDMGVVWQHRLIQTTPLRIKYETKGKSLSPSPISL
jgi:hypothetical protein